MSLIETALTAVQDDYQWSLLKLGVHSVAFATCAFAISRRDPEEDDVAYLSFLAVTGLLLTATIEELTMGRRDDFSRILDCLSSNLSTIALAYAALMFAHRGEVIFKATSIMWVLSHFYSFVASNRDHALRVAQAGDAASSLLAGVGFAMSLGAKVRSNPLAYSMVLTAVGGWAVGSYLYWYPEWFPEWFDARPWALPLLKVSTLSAYAATVAATILVTRRPPAAPAYVTYGAMKMHTR